MDFKGLTKVISGGQCGVDKAALVTARACGLVTGGTAPRGWRTHFGSDPSLSEFGLREHFSPAYPPRTEKNVIDSDATLVIGSDMSSPGVSLTMRMCRIAKKPFITITPMQFGLSWIDGIADFIEQYQVETLNVAGNRDKSGSFHADITHEILKATFDELEKRGKLNKMLA